jgi:hypothetical protein
VEVLEHAKLHSAAEVAARICELKAGAAPQGGRDRHLQSVIAFTDSINHVCLCERRPIEPPHNGAQALLYAKAQLPEVLTDAKTLLDPVLARL